MSTHTHRGHCQICLRVQAIDMRTGLISKHGYNVAHGYFAGTCPGSHMPTLHVDRSQTDKLIERCHVDAISDARVLNEYEDGSRLPAEASNGEWIAVEKVNPNGRKYTERTAKRVPFADAPEYHKQHEVQCAKWALQQKIKRANDYANLMTEWANKITGKVEAYRAEDLDVREWAVGDVVRIGAKSGFNATIEAIEDRVYTTRGFRRSLQVIMCPHGRVTRPAREERRSRTGIITHEAREALTYWEALRHIKRPKSPLIESLKKAGLL